jgi:hypothetical protein
VVEHITNDPMTEGSNPATNTRREKIVTNEQGLEGNVKRIRQNKVGLDHPLDSVTNIEYKLLHFLINIFYKEKKALAFNRDRCCYLVLCL